MKETILLFHAPAKEQRLKIEMALFPLKVRLRYIKLEDYNQPLGALAGLQEVPPVEEPYIGEDIPDTMFVFAFSATAA